MKEQRMVLRDGRVVVRAYTRDGYDGFQKMVAWCRAHGYEGTEVTVAFAGDEYYGEPAHYGAETAPVIWDERQ